MRMARLIASSSVHGGQVAGKSVGFTPPGRDGLVLEVVEDVAVLAVELADAAQRRDPLHDLGDELVRAHAVRPPLVGHEDLVGRHALLEGLGQPVQDVGLVVQDEVEAEIDHRLLPRLVAQALERLGQRLPRLVVVLHEREQRRQPGVRGGHRRRCASRRRPRRDARGSRSGRAARTCRWRRSSRSAGGSIASAPSATIWPSFTATAVSSTSVGVTTRPPRTIRSIEGLFARALIARLAWWAGSAAP